MIVVAGIGNVFFGDDGFGPAVITKLEAEEPPIAGVRLVDAGVRTMHLAYDLADGIDLFVAVDAYDGGDPPGTLTVLELAPDSTAGPADGHGMALDQLLALTRQLGPGPTRTLLVGCQPETLSESLGLSAVVDGAVERAVTLVRCIIDEAGSGDLASAEVGDGGHRELGGHHAPRGSRPMAPDAGHVEP